MAKSSQISALLLLGICIGLLILSLYFRVEGFEEGSSTDVPDVCKKAGWTYSKGILQVIKDFYTPYGDSLVKEATKQVTQLRNYTRAECKSLGGIYSISSEGVPICWEEKSAANEVSLYNIKCVGLNSQSTPPPQECYVNKEVIGKPNVEFTVKIGDFPLKVPAGTVLLYTQEECDKLGGDFINAGIIKDQGHMSARDWILLSAPFLSKLTDADVNDVLAANGYDKGMCKSKDNVIYNVVCAAGNTGFSKAIDTVSSGAHAAFNRISKVFS